MNLRDRAWRAEVARVIGRLDARINSGELEFDTLARLMATRGRLAGSLGAEEGHTSTPQLRRRTEMDHAEALQLLGEKGPRLQTPDVDAPTARLEKSFASYRSASPIKGDRA